MLSRFRIHTVLLAAVLVLVIIQFSLYQSTVRNLRDNFQEAETGMLSQQAIGISLATYSGCRNLLQQNSALLEVEKLNKAREVLDIKVVAVIKHLDGSVTVRTEMTDTPGQETVYHEMRFEKHADKWLLMDFGIDK